MALHSIELCAGVGMLGEGARAAFEFLGHEHRTVCYVEREAAAAAQLVCLMEAGALDPAPVWSDLLTFDGAAWRGCVDLLIAGFPCQDISIAGRRAGLDGKRSGLFFNILDIADACGAWGLVLENVSAIATATATAVDEAEGALDERAAARVVGELADRGWDAEWITIPASDVGASHGRARWFCFAWRAVDNAGCVQRRAGHEQSGPTTAEAGGHQSHDGAADRGCDVAHPSQPRLPNTQQREPGGARRWIEGGAVAELCAAPLFAPGPADTIWRHFIGASRVGAWERAVTDDEAGACPWAPATKPGVRMLADGLAIVVDESRAHQLRQAGNGVVPLQAAVALVELVRRAARH